MTTTKRYYGDNLDTLRRLSTTSRFRQPTILLGFLVTSLLLYATALDVGFIHDDFVFLTIRGVDMFSMSHTIYRPFGLMLFAAFNQLAGDAAPIAIHAFGIAAHAFCAYLLFRLTYALTGHSVLSLLAALAWLSSPAAVAPVYWSSAVIFYPPMTAVLLITMLYAHRAFGSLCQDEHPATGTYLKLGVTLALVGAVGLMFHEQALVLPVLLALLLYGGFFYPRPRVRVPSHLMLWAPTALVALLYGATRVYLQAPPNLASYTVSERTALLPYAVWRAFMPTERFIWHVVHPVATLHPLAAVALVGAGACAAVALLWARHSTRPLVFGGLAIIVAALPPLVAASTGGRYLYVASSMGMLTFGLAGKIVLDKGWQRDGAARARSGRGRMAAAGVFVLWLALVAGNVARGQQEAREWLDTSRLVARMEAEVTRLVSEAKATVGLDDTGHLQIMTVDFPAGTLNSEGVVRALARAEPRIGSAVVVTAHLYNERNQFRQRSRWPGTYIAADDLFDAVAGSVVLVYCEVEGAVFSLNVGPVPCVGAQGE